MLIFAEHHLILQILFLISSCLKNYFTCFLKYLSSKSCIWYWIYALYVSTYYIYFLYTLSITPSVYVVIIIYHIHFDFHSVSYSLLAFLIEPNFIVCAFFICFNISAPFVNKSLKHPIFFHMFIFFTFSSFNFCMKYIIVLSFLSSTLGCLIYLIVFLSSNIYFLSLYSITMWSNWRTVWPFENIQFFRNFHMQKICSNHS